MAYRVAYNLSQRPLIVDTSGRVLPVGSYGAVDMTDDTLQDLLEREPRPLRLLTPTELKGSLPDEVQAAVDDATARKTADDAAAAEQRAADEAEAEPPPASPPAKAPAKTTAATTTGS